MKKIKEIVINAFRGFCMALADSVPGVSGGTVAFILGFYDKFIGSLNSLLRGNMEEKKKSIVFLLKIGIGWLIGMALASTVLSSLFETQIYAMSSLFIGFIIFAIPIVIYEEKECMKGNYKDILFTILGILLVVVITILKPANVNIANLSFGVAIYVFIAAAIAITAMVLPGISGSTLLLIFGLYTTIMEAVKEVLHMNMSYLPLCIIFGLGVVTGVIVFVGLINKALTKYRSKSMYTILGMMIGSIYSIIQGATTLEVPQPAMSFDTFSIGFFVIGAVIIGGLQLIKNILNKKENDEKIKKIGK